MGGKSEVRRKEGGREGGVEKCPKSAMPPVSHQELSCCGLLPHVSGVDSCAAPLLKVRLSTAVNHHDRPTLTSVLILLPLLLLLLRLFWRGPFI